MGVWDFINSSIDKTKQYVPTPTSIKNASWTSYTYSSYAVKKVDQVVRVDGVQRLYSFCSDPQGQQTIARFMTKLAANAGSHVVNEGVKLLPGGEIVSKVVSKTVRDMKSEGEAKEKSKIMQTDVGEDSKARTISVDESELLLKRNSDLKLSKSLQEYEIPEDVIQNFMATEIGSCFFADLMVTKLHGVKKD